MEELNSLYESLLVELECPVCTNYMTPPIRQCQAGHSVCEPCRKKIPHCPLCRSEFTGAKNISLEALACKMHYPCINKTLGCEARFTLDQRENHIKNCSFRGFTCALNTCTWTGKLEDISKHWASKQLKNKVYQSSNVCRTKIIKTMSCQNYHFDYVNLVEAHNQLFWFKCKLGKGKIYWAVQLIGPKDKANDFFYEIEIFKPNISKPTITFSNSCQPVDIDDNDLFMQSICAATNINCVSHFMDKNYFLTYYMRVYERAEVNDNQQYCPETKSNVKKGNSLQEDEEDWEILTSTTQSYLPPNSRRVFSHPAWSLLFKHQRSNPVNIYSCNSN